MLTFTPLTVLHLGKRKEAQSKRQGMLGVVIVGTDVPGGQLLGFLAVQNSALSNCKQRMGGFLATQLSPDCLKGLGVPQFIARLLLTAANNAQCGWRCTAAHCSQHADMLANALLCTKAGGLQHKHTLLHMQRHL